MTTDTTVPMNTTTNSNLKVGDVDVWEETHAGRADDAGVSYYVLLKSIDTGRLKDVPRILSGVIERQAWKRWRWIGNEFTASTIDDYCTMHPPRGLGASVDLVRRLLADYPDVLERFDRERDGEAVTLLDVIDKENRRDPGSHGKGRPLDLDNKKDGVQVYRAPTGNKAAAALRRLHKDRPDIHQRVLAGELSPHAGMIEAGFRKPRASRKTSPLEKIIKLLPKLDAEGRRAVRIRLGKLDGVQP